MTLSTPSTSATCVGDGRREPAEAAEAAASLITTKSPVNPREISLSMEAFTESAKTSRSATRLTPMRSAEAVAEVRFGLRAAFSTASLPVMPLAVDTPRPAKRTLGPARTGPNGDGGDHEQPRTQEDPGLHAGGAVAGPPQREEVGGQQAEAEPDADADLRRAGALDRHVAHRGGGSTRVARTAGMVAAIRVTPTPTSSARIVVVTVMVTPEAKSSPMRGDEALGSRMPTPRPSRRRAGRRRRPR